MNKNGMNFNNNFERKQRIINDVLQGKRLIVSDPQCECRKLAEALCGEIKEQKILFNLPR